MAIVEDTVSGTVTATTTATGYITLILSETLADSILAAATLSGNRNTTDTVTSTVTLASLLSAINEALAEALSTAIVAGSMTPLLTQLDSVVSEILATSALQRVDSVSAWAMNAKTKAFSQYEGYEFKAFFIHNGRPCGLTDQGVFELDGATDNGADIDAFVMTGKDDFDAAQLKRVPYIYLGVMNENGMTLTTITDDGQQNTYPIPESDTLRNQRAKIGMGLRSRYWQIALRNVGGGDFIIESIELLPTLQGRKLNG